MFKNTSVGLVRTKEQSCTEVEGAQELPMHTCSQAGACWRQPEEVAVTASDSHEQREREQASSETRSLGTIVAATGLREQVAQVRSR